MEITLFSKCVKDLIVVSDRVDVPFLGSFSAEMMPASYSDRQTTIHPPYRKMSFHKADVPLSEGRPLLDKVAEEIGVTADQAGVELGWCLSRLSSELESSKVCRLPGLGVMRANARNEFFFVPDDDLDIWPDGLGFEPIPIKVSEKAVEIPVEIPGQARNDVGQARNDVGISDGALPQTPPLRTAIAQDSPARPPLAADAAGDSIAVPVSDDAEGVAAGGFQRSEHFSASEMKTRAAETDRHRIKPLWIVLIVLGILLVLFIAACYLFTDTLSPVIDWLLYTKEERMLLGG